MPYLTPTGIAQRVIGREVLDGRRPLFWLTFETRRMRDHSPDMFINASRYGLILRRRRRPNKTENIRSESRRLKYSSILYQIRYFAWIMIIFVSSPSWSGNFNNYCFVRYVRMSVAGLVCSVRRRFLLPAFTYSRYVMYPLLVYSNYLPSIYE